MDKLSVIVTARNAERTIAQTLRSLRSQLKDNDEILVLLDACSDRTGERAERLGSSKIKIFESQEVLGRSEGRNFLIRNSDSTLIAICDSDDVALPWRLELARALLDSHDAVFGTAVVFGKQLRPIPIIPQVPRSITPSQMPIELLGRNPIVHSTATFKRSILETVGLYRDSEAEEYDLWLRMVNADFRLFRSAAPVAMYRVHPSQASQSPGFVSRGLNCPFVVEEQRRLAVKLGLRLSSIGDIRREAQDRVRETGTLAKLEIAGLPAFLTKRK